jgi:hypothetical protein
MTFVAGAASGGSRQGARPASEPGDEADLPHLRADRREQGGEAHRVEPEIVAQARRAAHLGRRERRHLGQDQPAERLDDLLVLRSLPGVGHGVGVDW